METENDSNQGSRVSIRVLKTSPQFQPNLPLIIYLWMAGNWS